MMRQVYENEDEKALRIRKSKLTEYVKIVKLLEAATDR